MDPNNISMQSEESKETKVVQELGKSPEQTRTKEQQEDYEKAVIELVKEGYETMAENHNGIEGLRRQYLGYSDEEIQNVVGEKIFNETIEKGKKYHTTSGHLTPLYIRAPRMAEAMGMSRNKLRLARAVISWHDAIIDVKNPPEYNPGEPKTIVAMAARKRGAREGDFSAGAEGNEAKSAKDLAEKMRTKMGRDGKPIFTEDEIKTAILAIDVTYPGFDGGPDFQGANFEGKPGDIPPTEELLKQNPALKEKIDEIKKKGIVKGPKFFQPHLEKMLEEGQPVPEEVLIMAMTDLGGSGVASAEQFAVEGDSEYWEVMPNIEKNLQDLATNPAMDAERALVIGNMRNWIRSQVGFVTWQALRFEKIINLLKTKTHQLPEGTSQKEARLRQLFGNYTKNMDAAMARAERVDVEVEKIQTEGLADITDPEAKKAKEAESRIKAFNYIAKEMHYNV